MTDIKSLHRDAMDKTDLAILAKQKGNTEESLRYFQEAYALEKEAAFLLERNLDQEPTRSVLFRSAASLALDCNQTADAEKLICLALAGQPPEEIAEELRDLLEQVYFQRHLALRGISLHGNEIQMSIAGNGVGFGIAPTNIFLDRVEKTETLLYRTAERKQKKPYRDRGRRDKNLQDNVELFMSVPRAASYAVTFRVGKGDQLNLFGASFEEEIIDELLDCLELYVSGDEDALKDRIPEEDYYKNFVGLAGAISPDGDEINLVGFTTQRNGETKKVAMPVLQDLKKTTKKKHTSVPDNQKETAEESLEIIGILKYADSLSKKDKIQIIDASLEKHTLIVPAGMMSDIVKPLWDSKVIAIATKKGKSIHLEDIRPYKGSS